MQTITGRQPKFWYQESSNSELFESYIDDEVTYNEKPALLISSKDATYADCLQLKQSIDGNAWFGKRVRISCFVKTADVQCYATLLVTIKNSYGQPVVLDPMIDRAVDGTSDWREIFSVIDVPEDGRWISFGPCLWGNGKMWVADFKFEAVSGDVERTDDDGTTSGQYSSTPTNLDFSESDSSVGSLPNLAGWHRRLSTDNYSYSVSPNAYEGHNAATIKWIKPSTAPTKRTDEEANSGYLCQSFRAKPYRNNKIKYTVAIKTVDVEHEATLVLMVNGVNGARLALSRLDSLIGTNDWAEYSCVLDVSNFAYSISIWMQMAGRGQTSFAKVSLEKVDASVPTTDGNHHPRNLDFVD